MYILSVKKFLDDMVTIHKTGNSSPKSIKKFLDKESLKHLTSISKD